MTVNTTLLKAIVWLLLVLAIIVFARPDANGECQPVKLNRGEGVDWNCKLFRRVTRNGQLFIERLRPDRTVIAIEAVDCSKAVYVADGGWMEVPMHIIAGNIYCSTPPPRRAHAKVHDNQPRENERAGNSNHPAH